MQMIKKIKKIQFSLAAIFVVALFSVSTQAADYVAGKYSVDNAHTRASFVVPHFVISEVEGRFNQVQGEFTLAAKFNDTKLTATIPIASIDTGVKQRDDHLKSADFFEVEKYPEMKLVSKKITGNAKNFKMVADLTIKDVTKEITFDGKYTGSVKDPQGKQRAAFQATATINRKDFNINYDDKISLGSAVGDKVQIRLWTEGILEEEKK